MKKQRKRGKRKWVSLLMVIMMAVTYTEGSIVEVKEVNSNVSQIESVEDVENGITKYQTTSENKKWGLYK